MEAVLLVPPLAVSLLHRDGCWIAYFETFGALLAISLPMYLLINVKTADYRPFLNPCSQSMILLVVAIWNL